MNGADRELGRRRRFGAVEVEEQVEVVVAEAIEEAGVPAEGCCSEGDGGKGMADIVVAVMEGTLAILTSLALEDGGESEEKDGATMIGEEGREVEVGAELEGVVFGGVVGEKRGGGGEGGVNIGERRRKEVGFGGVEVAATRVDSEGPGGEAGGLSGEQGEGVVEEAGEGGTGDRVRWGRKRREKRVVERGVARERARHGPRFTVPGTARDSPAQNGTRTMQGSNFF